MNSLLIFFFAHAFAQPSPSLETKLQKQWDHYQTAQQLILNQMQKTELPIADRAVTRDVWENILNPKDDSALNAQDLTELRQSQRQRIDKARKKAIVDSLIHLDDFRKLPDSERQTRIDAFCAQIPKGGMLHIHPGGTLNRQTVQELITKNNPMMNFKDLMTEMDTTSGNVILYENEKQWLGTFTPPTSYLGLSEADQNHVQDFLFLPPGKHPFPRFNAVFYFLDYAITDWPSYEKALLDFAKRAVREGVSYVEFTDGVAPEFFTILQKIKDETGLIIRVNASFNRRKSLEKLDDDTKALLTAPANPWVVGIDFLDNEDGNPALEKGQGLYGTVLAAVRNGQSQLHRTMHAGEIGDVRNPRDAMILGAERLGHGVRLNEDPVALEYAARHHVAVEVNLSSNLRLTSVAKFSEHPFLDYLRLGVPVSLSTDDEGIFDTDIQQECVHAVTETDVTYAELKQMAVNSIETSFANDTDKAQLKSRLLNDFLQFEKAAPGPRP
jgi:adenosine deaminase CECR1